MTLISCIVTILATMAPVMAKGAADMAMRSKLNST
ncbi:uncharacterized protein METZ01_LOCUS320411 [marine metagenome]|uniref:Uncharacterized protein n=1 Tax=marine metagenome TaxID=408172 RepID=A0A382P428_9ZZZZ